MPEITSKERIIAKLRDFDERMAGAVEAAKKIVEAKDNVLTIGQSVTDALQQILELSDSIQNMETDWDNLKSEFARTREEFINDVQNRLIEHQELETLSREHQKKTAADREIIVQQINNLQKLLKNSRQELETEIKGNLVEAGKYIYSQVNEIENSLGEKQQESMKSFKENVKKELYDHQQSVERNLTEFLNKQNTLVQNLTQQIDGFHRSSQALASEQQKIQQNFIRFEAKVIKDSDKQNASIGQMQSEIALISARLEQTVTSLKDFKSFGRRPFGNLK